MLNHPLQSPQLQPLLTALQGYLSHPNLKQTQHNWAQGVRTARQAVTQTVASRNQIQATPLSVRQRRIGQSFLLILCAIALLIWNWKLLLAFLAGLAAMALIYQLQTRDLKPLLAGLRHWLTGPHRLLLLCVPCGGITMLGTYMATSIWDDSHSAWLVSCILLQGLGMIAGLTLLSMQFIEQQSDRADNNFDDTLAELTHPNPLNRLIAVRQLSRQLERNLLSPDQARTATQALQLLLPQEPEALVREATLRSLEPSPMQPRFSQLEESSADPTGAFIMLNETE